MESPLNPQGVYFSSSPEITEPMPDRNSCADFMRSLFLGGSFIQHSSNIPALHLCCAEPAFDPLEDALACGNYFNSLTGMSSEADGLAETYVPEFITSLGSVSGEKGTEGLEELFHDLLSAESEKSREFRNSLREMIDLIPTYS